MSTSSSEVERTRWRTFIAVLLGVTAVVITVALVFVAVVDPYDNLAFSPRWKRARVTTNERYAFPALIRHGNFDSAIFGTSTVMLLKPSELSERLGGRFANFAMASGTAWEQSELMKFFVSHTPTAVRQVIVAVDVVWCNPITPGPKLTPRPYPFWEYDDDPFNDYVHLLNTRAISHAALQLLAITGLWRSTLSDDGYFQFTPDDHLYDASRARSLLYRSDATVRAADLELPAVAAAPKDWTYPDLAMLADALDRFPQQTRKILMFVPYHLAMIASAEAWSKYTYCKSAVVRLARARHNVVVIDFMRPSVLTRNDQAYWDSLHYRVGFAPAIIDALREAVVSGQNSGALYGVLWPPASAK